MGGWGRQGPTDSTEILLSGSDDWKEISSFPFPVFALGGISYDNTILTFGIRIRIILFI